MFFVLQFSCCPNPIPKEPHLCAPTRIRGWTMNDHEAGRIAAALNQARPDWPTAQLKTLLRDPRIADRPRRDVFVALAWVACESNTATPYRVLEQGPWWRAAAVEGGGGRTNLFDVLTTCAVCNKHEDICQSVWLPGHSFTSAVDHERLIRSAAQDAREKRERHRAAYLAAQPTEETAVPITAETLPDERVTK